MHAAVKTYTRWIDRYALRALGTRILRACGYGQAKALCVGGGLGIASEEEQQQQQQKEEWDFQREILEARFVSPLKPPVPSEPVYCDDPDYEPEAESMLPPSTNVLIQRLLMIECMVLSAATKCKARDDSRGQAIIDDYAETHTPAEMDAVLRQARARHEDLQDEVCWLLQAPGSQQLPPFPQLLQHL